MPPSPKRPDRLAKRLHYHLSQRLSPHQLREIGWFDYLNLEADPPSQPVPLASDALIYVSIFHARWSGNLDVLVGIVAFLNEQLDLSPSGARLQGLKSILEAEPVDEAAVRGWFADTYGSG